MAFELITEEKNRGFELLPMEETTGFELIGETPPLPPTEPTLMESAKAGVSAYFGQPSLDTFVANWKEGIATIKNNPETVLDIITQPFHEREPVALDKSYSENVKAGLLNTLKGVQEVPFILPKMMTSITRNVLGEPIRKAIAGEKEVPTQTPTESFVSNVVTAAKGEVKNLVDMIVSGIPGLDKRWAESLFESPDTVVFGKLLARDVARGTVTSTKGVIGRIKQLKTEKAKVGLDVKIPEPPKIEPTPEVTEPTGATLEKMGIKEPKPIEKIVEEQRIAEETKTIDALEQKRIQATQELIDKELERLPEEIKLIEAEPKAEPIPERKGILGDEAGFIRIKGEPNPQGAKAMELVKRRTIDIDKAFLDSEAFIREFDVKLTKAEREAIPFIRQRIKDPQVLKDIGREDLIPMLEKPSPKLTKATERIGQYFDEAYNFLKENWGDIGFVEDYVTQIWDIPRGRRSEVVNYFTTHNPFTKKRTIPTLEEGIKLGLKPKELDISKILRIYDQYKIKAVHNVKFTEALKKLKDEEGNPLVMRRDKAPEDWVTVDHPALSRAMAIGKIGEEGVLLKKVPVKVHPDIAREVKIIFEKPFSHEAITAWETINAFTKKTMLTLSLFHHFALTESAFSSGIGWRAIKSWNPYRVYNAIKNKDFEIFKRQELAKDAIEHKVKFGALPDVQVARVRKGLEFIERKTKNIPIVRQATKKVRQANELWDTALWDYYHNTLKLEAYEKQVMAEIKRRKPQTKEAINKIKDEIGDFVNDSFGGQRWELQRVLGNRKVQQMLQWVLLAPDWTISVLKQAIAPVKGIVKGKPSMAVRGTLFWARAAMYYNLIAQSVNYYNTNKYLGEGRFTWDNDPGHELNIFAGFNEDGTKKYIRMGKQFREVMEWSYEPVRKLGAKLSPLLRETMRQITAHDPGSGYPTEFAEQEFFESIPERLKSVAEMPIPFSLRPYIKDRPTMFMFSLPGSKGMTNFKTIKLFKEELRTMKSKADKLRKMKALTPKAKDKILQKHKRELQRIYISALENNLDAESLFKTAQSSVKADITLDNKKIAQQIYQEIKLLKGRAILDALKVYKDRGILTPEIEHELNKLDKKTGSIAKQKKQLPKLLKEFNQ